MPWESVIGLEIHAQLSTRSKIFSGASTTYGAAPNRQACAVDLGLPGVLPVLNAEVVRMAVMFGIAVDAQISQRSVFARKNYFYPDLPKGYQISQFELPVVQGGHVDIQRADGAPLRINLTRAHLEEDAGKSLHAAVPGQSGIDLNRAGTPLIEIVSEPDLRSAVEAVTYMRKVHEIVRYLGICDGNMQEGSFRCDANVSIRRPGQSQLGTRTELKNLNSFRFVERAIEHEIERQTGILERGGTIAQETRLYDADTDQTHAMRSKEEANDYRYFPDPDLLPLEITESYVASVRAKLPELPDARRRRFESEFQLSAYDVEALTSEREVADYFETAVAATGGHPKLVANWINGELSANLNREHLSIDRSRINPEALGQLLQRIADDTISGKIAKQVFDAMWRGEGDADAIIDSGGLRQITDSDAIERLVDEVIASSPEQAAQLRAGKDKVLGYFVGQIMKRSQGKANPQRVTELLRAKLLG